MTKQHLALILVTLMPGLFFSENPGNEMDPIVYTPQNAPYFEVSRESDADAVLMLKVKLPSIEDEFEWEFYLKQNPRPIPSRTVKQIGSAFASCSTSAQTIKGVTSGSVSLNASSAGVILVEMSLYWTSAKGNQGKLEGGIDVEWLGKATKEMGQETKAQLSFRDPKK